MQVWPLVHCSLVEQGQLDDTLVQTGREHAPSTQSAPPEQSAVVRHAPGLRVGVRSVGATLRPRVVPEAPRQTQPWAQSVSLEHEAVQPTSVHT